MSVFQEGKRNKDSPPQMLPWGQLVWLCDIIDIISVLTLHICD